MFDGSLVALVTPMTRDGSIDYGSLERLIEFHIEQGTDGFVIAGTTGESATLTKGEHIALIGEAVRIVDRRKPVIAGTGSNSTAQTADLSRAVQKFPIDALLLVTPYYNKPTQEGLFQHFTTVSEAVDVPVILYNVPGRTACDLLAETVERLAENPRIVGIKEATGDLSRGADILRRCGKDFCIYSGDDATALDLMLGGAHGVVSVTANVAPRAMREMCEAVRFGDPQKAAELNAKLVSLHEALFVEANPIPVKWAVAAMGLIPDGIRLPLTWLSKDRREAVAQAMSEAEIPID